jgi:hypothetical protein
LKLVEVFRTMAADVDANLSHRIDAQRVHVTCGLGTRASNSETLAEGLLQNPFGNVGPAAVAGTENQYKWFVHGSGGGVESSAEKK